jgi:cell division protein FtsL
MNTLLMVAACFVFYVVLGTIFILFVVTVAACVEEAKKHLAVRRGIRRLEHRIAEDTQVADLDAVWEMPTRDGWAA